MGKPLRNRKLRNLSDCIRAGQWLWNQIAQEAIDPAFAGKLVYLLNVQKGILVDIERLEIEKKQINDFEMRLTKIETAIEKQIRKS